MSAFANARILSEGWFTMPQGDMVQTNYIDLAGTLPPWPVGFKSREGSAHPLLQHHLPIVSALGVGRVRGDVWPVGNLPTEVCKPVEDGMFDVVFGDGGHGVSTSAPWISFNDRLSASFHSARPFADLPNRTPAAVEGEVKM